ncbi:MAG: GntR family transcriptional regulator [bacterium]
MTFRAKNLPEQIAFHLRDQIVHGELAPGARIAEADLAEKLGVSRAPIREAFRILEKKMLLELMPRRGARVTEISPAFVEWLYDVLTELYALLVKKASANRQEHDLKRLRDALKKMEEAAASGDAGSYHNALFAYGSTCLEAAGDPLLGRLLDDFEPSLRRMQFAIFTERVEGLKKHVPFAERVMSYIEERNGPKAAETMRDYMHKGKDLAMSLSRKHSGNSQTSGLAGNPQR